MGKIVAGLLVLAGVIHLPVNMPLQRSTCQRKS